MSLNLLNLAEHFKGNKPKIIAFEINGLCCLWCIELVVEVYNPHKMNLNPRGQLTSLLLPGLFVALVVRSLTIVRL
jgi:hypothetical protein